MTILSAALDGALAGISATIFGAVEIVMPSHNIRLLDGAGTATFDGKTFTGSDATFGTLAQIDKFEDGSGDDSPSMSITLNPASSAAAADLCSPAMQGSPVSCWLGALNPATGAVLGEPDLLFSGLLDVATLKAGKGTRTVEYEVTSIMEDFFLNDDGVRLAGSWHKAVWPGELGLDFVSYVQRQIYWGQNDQSGVTKTHGVRGIISAARQATTRSTGGGL